MFAQPAKKPTPAEYKVIAFILSAGAILLGLYFLYDGLTGKIKNPEDAGSVVRLGLMLLAAGILGPIIGNFIVRRLFD